MNMSSRAIVMAIGITLVSVVEGCAPLLTGVAPSGAESRDGAGEGYRVFFDKTGDEGDDGCLQRAWPRPWCWRDAKTVRRLKAITMPGVYFYAPATMKDFVEYMGRATKDFDSPDIPLESRGITFVCADSVAAKTGPEKPKQETALIPCDGIGATTTAWDALTNVCNSVGCRFEVVHGEVEIGE